MEVVADLLGVKQSRDWSLFDQDDHLHLYHYEPEANFREHAQIRGLIVDKVEKLIVARSFGYTPTVVKNEILRETCL